mmetsp:Transcript_41924/g.90900  ORF Transcript_41924/g.90900 Transcript_41924/m.90900 type:complete len:244 (+) Transcript_41924:1623-2354(+)
MNHGKSVPRLCGRVCQLVGLPKIGHDHDIPQHGHIQLTAAGVQKLKRSAYHVRAPGDFHQRFSGVAVGAMKLQAEEVRETGQDGLMRPNAAPVATAASNQDQVRMESTIRHLKESFQKICTDFEVVMARPHRLGNNFGCLQRQGPRPRLGPQGHSQAAPRDGGRLGFCRRRSGRLSARQNSADTLHCWGCYLWWSHICLTSLALFSSGCASFLGGLPGGHRLLHLLEAEDLSTILPLLFGPAP